MRKDEKENSWGKRQRPIIIMPIRQCTKGPRLNNKA